MEVAIFKQYDGSVGMLIASQEMLDLGHTVAEVAARDIPAPLSIPEVDPAKQHLIKEYDKPDANGVNVLRYNGSTGQYETLLDDAGNVIPVTGTINYSHDFLVLDDSTLPSERFFAAWEVDSALLVTGSGTAAHPDFYGS